MTAYAKSRHWFQFHLSTSIVLMFVTAGFLWPNCQTYKIANEPEPIDFSLQSTQIAGRSSCSMRFMFKLNHGFGWPCCACQYNPVLARFVPSLRGYHLNVLGLAVDTMLLMLCLGVTGFILERRPTMSISG